MKVKNILEASEVSQLMSLGSYHDVKSFFEAELGSKLGVAGWESFFNKIQELKVATASNKEYLLAICSKKTLKESKLEISILLKVDVKAKNLSELSNAVNSIISAFSSCSVDPYEHYEKTKFKKFQDSSRLEGMDIEIPDEKTTLESVLAKYRK